MRGANLNMRLLKKKKRQFFRSLAMNLYLKVWEKGFEPVT